ncbi:putative ethylene-responsive transcription factor 2 [Iris pallida]|uniref:Ethylene-responsive transcription factor 2 n=1 Tax=Iris pallida TaxID=29817 RepID=A0AAX6F066_IRIPA|nr:putative ethylene-responsive transcription factor 2 [Iris pallida]
MRGSRAMLNFPLMIGRTTATELDSLEACISRAFVSSLSSSSSSSSLASSPKRRKRGEADGGSGSGTCSGFGSGSAADRVWVGDQTGGYPICPGVSTCTCRTNLNGFLNGHRMFFLIHFK